MMLVSLWHGRIPGYLLAFPLSKFTNGLDAQGNPGNARDFLWRQVRSDASRAALTVAFVPGEGGLRANFLTVVAL
jgi:hypothetical protein